jgi:hypothetical protein
MGGGVFSADDYDDAVAEGESWLAGSGDTTMPLPAAHRQR